MQKPKVIEKVVPTGLLLTGCKGCNYRVRFVDAYVLIHKSHAIGLYFIDTQNGSQETCENNVII